MEAEQGTRGVNMEAQTRLTATDMASIQKRHTRSRQKRHKHKQMVCICLCVSVCEYQACQNTQNRCKLTLVCPSILNLFFMFVNLDVFSFFFWLCYYFYLGVVPTGGKKSGLSAQ